MQWNHPSDVEIVNEKIYKKHGDKIIMSNYISSKDKADFLCNICKYTWKAIPSIVYSRTGCPNCAGTLRYTYDEVLDIVKQKNCILLSKNYLNCHTKLKIKFPCGHIQHTVLPNFINRTNCGKCDRKNNISKKSEKIAKEKIENLLDKLKYNLISINGNPTSKVTITYICDKGHKITQPYATLRDSKLCKKCGILNMADSHRGSKYYNWKGRAKIHDLIRNTYLKEWKKESMRLCNYKCIISGENFSDIHHLYPLNKIIDEAFDELKIKKKENVEGFSNRKLDKIIKKIMEIHAKYPLGVCLTRKLHVLFHKKYGKTNFTIQDFEEFKLSFNKNEGGKIL